MMDQTTPVLPPCTHLTPPTTNLTSQPAEYQQTLIKSFTLGGIGLHTGEYAYVRVRPAFASEGRYFVRVPPGTNSGLFELQEPTERGIENLGDDYSEAANDPEIESLRLQLFQEYLRAQEQGFSGAFSDYVESVDFQRKGEVLEK